MRLNRSTEALSTLDRVTVNSVSDDMTESSRRADGLASWMKGRLLSYLERSEEAASVLLSTLEFIRKDDDADLRRVAVEALVGAGIALTNLNRDEQAIAVRERIVHYVRSDDSENLRRAAVRAWSANYVALCDRGRYKEIEDYCDMILDYVVVEDSPETRRFAFLALGGKWLCESMQGRHEHVDCAWQKVMKHVRRDDPKWLLTVAAGTLTVGGRILIDLERYSEAEGLFGGATEIDEEHAESWAYRAQSVLLQANSERFSEAEKLAKRAVELNPASRLALHTLADVLSWRGNWPEALDRLEQALQSDEGQPKERAGKDVVDSLIRAAAAGSWSPSQADYAEDRLG